MAAMAIFLFSFFPWALCELSSGGVPAPPPITKEATQSWKLMARGWVSQITGAKKVNTDPTPMKVIGAGLGRTGSNSLMLALDMLGYKTYHMERVMEYGHQGDWSQVRAPANKTNSKALTAVLDRVAAAGFTAGVDYPICGAYRELMERWPEAPVILSIRSSPEVWAKSFYDTIYQIEQVVLKDKPPLKWIMPGFLDAIHWMRAVSFLPTVEDTTLERLASGYSKWNEDVKKHVPAEKLLVWKVQDGWEPLCRHLKISDDKCPKDPFPRGKNDTADMQFTAKLMSFITDWFSLVVTFVLILFVCVVFALFRCCCGTSSQKKNKKTKQG